jgi:nucleoside 2-deoxyribosyltransferase
MVTLKIKTIVICASAAFYEHVNEVAEELEKLGFRAVVPHNAQKMKKQGNYNVEAVKTWFKNPEDFSKKANFMRMHFDEVAKGDAVLVVNDEKRGVPGYIGSNVSLEMGLAFYLKKPIYILNPVQKGAPNYEEVIGVGSIIINSDLKKIKP